MRQIIVAGHNVVRVGGAAQLGSVAGLIWQAPLHFTSRRRQARQVDVNFDQVRVLVLSCS
jgi:hypothetical protein